MMVESAFCRINSADPAINAEKSYDVSAIDILVSIQRQRIIRRDH